MARVKLVPGLDCSAPADKMLRLVLRTQLKAMCALRNEALDWDDVKGVHDMRVLSRRLRSAISDLKPYLEKSGLPQLKLKAIARSLGAVRDEDVALVSLEELKIHAEHSDTIDLFARERCRRRDEARAALESVMSHSAIKEFRKEFLAKLRALTIAKRSTASNQGAWSFGKLGAYVINRRLKEVNDASRSIYFPFEIKEIHKLRILVKRLRYAMEMFAVCWGSEVEDMAKELSLLQDSLGALHDCDVWIERLGARLAQTAQELKTDDEQVRLREGAMWLLEYFAGKRTEHYRDALTRWYQWEDNGFLKKLKSTFDSEVSISLSH